MEKVGLSLRLVPCSRSEKTACTVSSFLGKEVLFQFKGSSYIVSALLTNNFENEMLDTASNVCADLRRRTRAMCRHLPSDGSYGVQNAQTSHCAQLKVSANSSVVFLTTSLLHKSTNDLHNSQSNNSFRHAVRKYPASSLSQCVENANQRNSFSEKNCLRSTPVKYYGNVRFMSLLSNESGIKLSSTEYCCM